jgi:UrcA family protein
MSVHRSLFVITATLSLLGASAALAQDDVRVPVGDLHSAAAARDFDHRLDVAARRFCSDRFLPVELDARATCIAAAREEAVAQLSADQREALADALAPAPKLAAR